MTGAPSRSETPRRARAATSSSSARASGDQQRAVGGPTARRRKTSSGSPGPSYQTGAVLGGDDQPRLLVEVGRQPQRDPLGVEQLPDRLDDLLGAGLVRGDLLDPAGEVVDPLDAVALAGDLAEPPEEQPDHGQHRDDEHPGPRAERRQQQHHDPDRHDDRRDHGDGHQLLAPELRTRDSPTVPMIATVNSERPDQVGDQHGEDQARASPAAR